MMIDKNEIYVQLGLLEESLAYTLGQISTVRDALDESLKKMQRFAWKMKNYANV